MREMKDSGIEWIGEIPKDWKVKNLKYFVSFQTGGTPRNKEGIDSYGDFSWFTPSDLDNNNLANSKFYISSDAVKNNGYNLFPPNSVLLCCIASVGKVGLNLYASYSNQQITGLIPFTNTQSKFIFYFMIASKDKISFDASSNVVPIINTKYLSSFSICFPDFVVQQQIANYLDTQCSEIDATAEDIQKEISLLEDYKKSVITEAVTKGLNPDAEMKDSKIFYLGQINKTWNLTKVGYCCKKLYRPFEPSDEALVCSNKGKVVPRGDTLIGLMTSDDNAMQGICKGDIAIHGMDTWHGAIACSEYDGKITRVVHVCKADGDNRFVVYWLQHLAFVGVYKLISNGVRGNTSDFRSWDKVADIYIPNPIKEEQQQIADFLDSKCSEIDSLIADKKRQLDILADYKRSLIYEYITGKKEVPVNE